jgi:hypothetical protein
MADNLNILTMKDQQSLSWRARGGFLARGDSCPARKRLATTLIKVLTGVERQDRGVIELDGREILAKSPHHAQTLGISTVYQEVNLCPNLSIAENILIGREPRFAGSIDWRRLNARAAQILEWLEIDVDVRQSVGMYPVAIQQMAILRWRFRLVVDSGRTYVKSGGA